MQKKVLHAHNPSKETGRKEGEGEEGGRLAIAIVTHMSVMVKNKLLVKEKYIFGNLYLVTLRITAPLRVT